MSSKGDFLSKYSGTENCSLMFGWLYLAVRLYETKTLQNFRRKVVYSGIYIFSFTAVSFHFKLQIKALSLQPFTFLKVELTKVQSFLFRSSLNVKFIWFPGVSNWRLSNTSLVHGYACILRCRPLLHSLVKRSPKSWTTDWIIRITTQNLAKRVENSQDELCMHENTRYIM